jgi:hypothetical protein
MNEQKSNSLAWFIFNIMSAFMFAAFQWGYSRGVEKATCSERHSYHYKKVSWFNGEVK